MNQLDTERRTRIIHCLVEGNSIRATVRMTGASKNTVAKLLKELGTACSDYQDKVFRNLKCKRLQCDEIWSFVGCKQKNVTPNNKEKHWGDCWTWTAIDADTKLVPCWFVGTRDAGAAYHFIHDLAARLAGRVQLTTDGHKAYLSAIEDAFGSQIDYAMLIKIYGNTPEGGEVRYSPAVCIGARKAVQSGNPDWKHIHQHCRAPEPFHANAHAEVYAADEWLLQESREPRTRAGALFHVLQFLPNTPNASGHTRNGSRGR